MPYIDGVLRRHSRSAYGLATSSPLQRKFNFGYLVVQISIRVAQLYASLVKKTPTQMPIRRPKQGLNALLKVFHNHLENANIAVELF